MRVGFADLLASLPDGTAVGAFTCYDLQTAVGVVRAAEARGRPVILLLGAASFAGPGGEALLVGLCAAADGARVPCGVQLDHCADLGLIARAFEMGAAAVMADGSEGSFEENLALVRGAAELAARAGAAIEAELGGIAGDEDVAEAVAAGALTDVAEAVELVRRTGAACLAVSIGNVHGHYREPPRLDWELLAAVRQAVAVPLSLHGASGLPDHVLQRAIAGGIAKVNVNTELREAYLTATADALPATRDGLRVQGLHAAQAAAVEAAVARKLTLYEAPG